VKKKCVETAPRNAQKIKNENKNEGEIGSVKRLFPSGNCWDAKEQIKRPGIEREGKLRQKMSKLVGGGIKKKLREEKKNQGHSWTDLPRRACERTERKGGWFWRGRGRGLKEEKKERTGGLERLTTLLWLRTVRSKKNQTPPRKLH